MSEPAFETSDLYLAAWLLACGEPMLGMRKSGASKFMFAFPKSCERQSFDWLSGNCMVSARLYADSIKALKSKLATSREGAVEIERRRNGGGQ